MADISQSFGGQITPVDNPYGYHLDKSGAVGREVRRGQDISIRVSLNAVPERIYNVTFNVDAYGILRIYDMSGALLTAYSPTGWLRVNVEAS